MFGSTAVGSWHSWMDTTAFVPGHCRGWSVKSHVSHSMWHGIISSSHKACSGGHVSCTEIVLLFGSCQEALPCVGCWKDGRHAL